MCPSREFWYNLARAQRSLDLFGKSPPDAASPLVSWLSVTEVVFACNPVEFEKKKEREKIFPVPSVLIKITLSQSIGP